MQLAGDDLWNAWRGDDPDADETLLLQLRRWLSGFLPRHPDFVRDEAVYVVLNGEGENPVLLLLTPDRSAVVSLDGEGRIESEYLPPLRGGSYRETFFRDHERNRLVLRILFEHPQLPRPVDITAEGNHDTLRRYERLRLLLSDWSARPAQ